jgi:hypothetical protein
MKLYAICWQDEAEPWGWAPISDPAEFVWGAELLPAGAFFWEPADAEGALARIVERLVGAEISRLREHDRARHAQEQAAYEADIERGHPLPGVTVKVVGQPSTAWKPEPPRPLSTDLRLRQEAERYAGRNFSIQTYQIPPPR